MSRVKNEQWKEKKNESKVEFIVVADITNEVLLIFRTFQNLILLSEIGTEDMKWIRNGNYRKAPKL